MAQHRLCRGGLHPVRRRSQITHVFKRDTTLAEPSSSAPSFTSATPLAVPKYMRGGIVTVTDCKKTA
jgi:hypothetical protein